MISQSQIEQYNDEGYTIVENVFSAEELNPILDEFEEIVDDYANKAFEAGKITDKHSDKDVFKRLAALEYDFKIQKAKKEAERKEIEAKGIAEFQKIVTRTITPQLLKWKGVEATQEIAKSPNSKVVVVGNGDGDLPIILGGQ